MAIMTAIAIGAVNYLAMEHRVRLDLTGDKRFTLSDGTQRLFDKLSDSITVTYYVDQEPPPKRINLERDVRDKLEELATSSQGRLQYKVERISNDEAADKAKELEPRGILQTVDVQVSGADDRAMLRGRQGYFSSIEVRYGAAEPKAINGVVNLVDKADEAREHRVDTLEFDIAYAVLTMQHDTKRPPFDRLLKSREHPLLLTHYVTDPLPEQFKQMAANVETALKEIAELVPQKVQYQQIKLGPDARQIQAYPHGGLVLLPVFGQQMEFVPDDQGRIVRHAKPLYCAVIIQPIEDRYLPVGDFTAQKSASEVRTLIEDTVWELVRPRTRLGFVLPPEDPRMRNPMQPPQPGQPPMNGHTALFDYVKRGLEYETEWVDIAGEKRIPRDIACLIVLEANVLKERELYEIERYLAEGGNVVMMVQGWDAELDFSRQHSDNLTLTKQDMHSHFEEWAKHIGIEFGQDLLLRANSKLQPYAVRSDMRNQWVDLAPVRLAPTVERDDMNADSVFTRGLTSLPLPLMVETKVDEDRLGELGLEKSDLIRLRGDVFRYIPSNPAMPEISMNFSVTNAGQVLHDPSAEPGKEIRAQKLDHAPLAAALISGEFPSFWVDEKRKIPGWEGDPEDKNAEPVSNRRKGNLLVVSTAGMLNTAYYYGYTQQEWHQVIVPRGLTYYRNIAEAFIYGEDLVGLRARTGVAPRIVGPVEENTRVLWFIACIAGVPMLLVLAGGARGYLRARERREYDAAFSSGGE
jgi:hypothetical protein